MVLGKIGLTCNFDWNEPRDKFNPDDLKASEIANQFWLGWYANPVYMNGDYPEIMKSKIANKSIHQNYKTSRLPKFTEKEKQYIKGNDLFQITVVTFNFRGWAEKEMLVDI